MTPAFTLWILFAAMVAVALAVDLINDFREDAPHVMPLRTAMRWLVAWIGMTAVFGGALFWLRGQTRAVEFLTAYLTEESLSIDNMMVFVMVFDTFKIAESEKPRILKWGVLGAILMRFLLIAMGVSLVKHFHWLFYVFGALLIYTAIGMMRGEASEKEPKKPSFWSKLGRWLPVTSKAHGGHFWIRESGRRMATPLLLALLAVESVDLLFAVDSIPAVLAISSDLQVAVTSNIFAVLGLRALFFIVSGFMGLFRYLRYGLGVALILIGLKMLLSSVWEIPTVYSLLVMAVALGGSMVASVAIKEKTS